MTREFRMGYIESVKERYLKATKAEKGQVLDELCRVCRLNRKYAITKIHQERFEREAVRVKRSGRKRLYPRKVLDVAASVWLVARPLAPLVGLVLVKALGSGWTVKVHSVPPSA